MVERRFHLRADQIKSLAEGHGGCFATDMITVHGKKVGFMYRQERESRPIVVGDSWRAASPKNT